MSLLITQRRFWFWFLTISTFAVIASSVYLRKPVSAPPALPVYGKIPDFQLTERSGETVSAQSLIGKIWIADFIFTRCAGICPMMSSHMKRIQEKIKDQDDIRLVSFSVDPEYDTPEVLKKYAERFEADPGKWLFLTGDKNQIHALSQQHFRLAVADVPEAERQAPEQTVDHSSKFVLVDEAGQIRGYYNSEELNFLDVMMPDVLRLIKE